MAISLQTANVTCDLNSREAAEQKKIKVLFIIDFIHTTVAGGTENQLVQLINGLDAGKFEKSLICLKDTQWLNENSSSLNCTSRAFSYNFKNHKDFRNIGELARIIKHIRSLDPDIVVTFFKISNMLGVLCARLAGVRLIFSTRRDYGLWLDRSIFLLRLANRISSGIIANARTVKELVALKERCDERKISVIYNGIDSRIFCSSKDPKEQIKRMLGIPSENRVVGIIAGLRPMKRYSTFLKAARTVLTMRPDVSFVIVGDGPQRNDIEAEVSELGIRDSIFFAGPQQDVRPYLAFFDIGVNSSANEGLSNAIMEYMASGIPCIVSDAGGNPELVRDDVNGYVFQLDNHEQLADRILNLLEDPKKQKEFTRKSQEIITTRFTLERMITGYDNYFTQSLLNGHNSEKKRER